MIVVFFAMWKMGYAVGGRWIWGLGYVGLLKLNWRLWGVEVVGGYSSNFCLALLGTRNCIFLSTLIEIYIII